MARLVAQPPRLLVLALCAAVLGMRRAQAWSIPQFWAEDGHFYERAYSIGWRSLLVPYAGYFHAVPRLIGYVASLLDPAAAPAVFVGFATLATLYVASLALADRCPLPRFAGLFALSVVLVPDTYEVLLNVANLQWVLGAGLVLILVSRDPAGAGEWAHDVAASALIGLTGPFSIVLSPLFAWRAWRRRTRASLVLAIVVAACALVQGWLLHTLPSADRGSAGGHFESQLVLPAIARRIAGSLLLGPLLPGATAPAAGALIGAATLAAVAWLALRRGPMGAERRVIGLVFALILGSALYRTRWTLTEYFAPRSDSRYVYLPQLAAIWLLLLAAAGGGRAAKAAGALAAWALLVNIPRYREPAYADMQWSLYVPAIRSGDGVSVPINPPGWRMALPARRK